MAAIVCRHGSAIWTAMAEALMITMIANNQYARIEIIELSYNGTRNASPAIQDNMRVMFSFTYEAE